MNYEEVVKEFGKRETAGGIDKQATDEILVEKCKIHFDVKKLKKDAI